MDAILEASEIFDNSLRSFDLRFTDDIVMFMESYSEELVVTEKQAEALSIRLNKFFGNLISAFRNFINTLTTEIERKRRGKEYQKKLRSLHKELRGIKDENFPVVIADVWAMRDKYVEACKELKGYANRFSKMRYSSTKKLDEDIDEFNRIRERYKQELEELSKKTVQVTPQKALKFVEDETTGRSKIFSSLNDAMATLEQMQKDCDLMEKRRDELGPDVLVKHAGAIKRVSIDISGFFKKWAVKIISTIVLIIG